MPVQVLIATNGLDVLNLILLQPGTIDRNIQFLNNVQCIPTVLTVLDNTCIDDCAGSDGHKQD